MTDYFDYARYLSKRSLIGLSYRKFWLYKRLSLNLKGKILDIGCGLGDFLEINPSAKGVDINPYTIKICCDKNLDAKLMEKDKIPYSDANFDSCLLDNVIEHLHDPTNLIIEIKRILKAKGKLLVGIPGEKGFLRDSDHKINYSEAALVNKFENFGFKLCKKFYMPLPIPFLTYFLKQHCIYFQFQLNN